MSENNQEIGPGRISFATFLLKILAGAAGGVGGSLILVLIFILASSVFEVPTSAEDQITSTSPIFAFILMMMIFLSTTIGNIVSTWLIALTERDKYTRISSAIYQVFVLSLIIFVFTAPIYLITAATNPTITAYVVALHIILSAQVSALILEIVSNYRYSLVGVYGVTFSVLTASGILFILSGVITSPQILLFAALPIVWGSMAFVGSIVTIFYGWLARTYDKDFLSTQTVYGNDYGKEVDIEVEEDPKAKDEAGSDFLRHN